MEIGNAGPFLKVELFDTRPEAEFYSAVSSPLQLWACNVHTPKRRTWRIVHQICARNFVRGGAFTATLRAQPDVRQ
jgi:hypothetical protein